MCVCSVEDDEKRAAALREAERSPLRHAQLGFFSKFFELQVRSSLSCRYALL